MSIFFNVFIKSIAFFLSIISIIIIISLSVTFFTDTNNNFAMLEGDESSSNVVTIIELNGLIVESSSEVSKLTNRFIISPSDVKKNFEKIKETSPKVIIISINTPGGTVSASKKLYDIIKNFKKILEK